MMTNDDEWLQIAIGHMSDSGDLAKYVTFDSYPTLSSSWTGVMVLVNSKPPLTSLQPLFSSEEFSICFSMVEED